MAKRFTDTDKWKDSWFENLSTEGKLFFFYYVDNCDHAGIWKGSFKHFNFVTNLNYSEERMISEFSAKIVKSRNNYYFMPNFIRFQYGALSPSNNAHKGVINSLKYNNLLSMYLDNNDLQTSPYVAPIEGHYSGAQDKDKDKDKDKEQEQEIFASIVPNSYKEDFFKGLNE